MRLRKNKTNLDKSTKYFNNDLVNNSERRIKSDFHLIFILIKDLILFLILLIPRLFLILYYLLFSNSRRANELFSQIILFPLKFISSIFSWFGQAKYTSFLSMLLILTFIVQFTYINFNQGLLESLMTNPLHFQGGNFHSVFTSVFLHGDIFHLLSNLIALTIFGRIVEKHLDKHILWIFVLSGILSNIISNSIAYFQEDIFFSLGASGAIAGLIILGILLSPLSLTTILVIPLPIFIIGWGLIALDIIGLTNPGKINHFAHLGGYLALLMIYFLLGLSYRKKLLTGFLINLGLIFLIYLLVAFTELGNLSINII